MLTLQLPHNCEMANFTEYASSIVLYWNYHGSEFFVKFKNIHVKDADSAE